MRLDVKLWFKPTSRKSSSLPWRKENIPFSSDSCFVSGEVRKHWGRQRTSRVNLGSSIALCFQRIHSFLEWNLETCRTQTILFDNTLIRRQCQHYNLRVHTLRPTMFGLYFFPFRATSIQLKCSALFHGGSNPYIPSKAFTNTTIPSIWSLWVAFTNHQ